MFVAANTADVALCSRVETAVVQHGGAVALISSVLFFASRNAFVPASAVAVACT